MNRSRFRGHISVLIAMFFFAFNLPAVKGLFSVGFSVSQIVLLKIIFGTLFFWICSWFTERESVALRDHLLFALNGITGILLLQFFLTEGLTMTTVVDAGIVFSFSIILYVLPALQSYKQKPVQKLSGVILAVSGISLLLFGYIIRTYGNLYVLLGTLAFVVNLWFIRSLLFRYRLVTILKWMFFWAMVISVVIMYKELLSIVSVASLYFTQVQIILLFVLLFPVILFYYLLLLALRRISSETALMYSFLVPVVATVVSLGVGQSVLKWNQPLAELFILAGMLLILYASEKEKRHLLHG